MQALDDMLIAKEFNFRNPTLFQKMYIKYSSLCHTITNSNDPALLMSCEWLEIECQRIKKEFNAYKIRYNSSTLQGLIGELEELQQGIAIYEEILHGDMESPKVLETMYKAIILSELIEMKVKNEKMEEIDFYLAMELDECG